MDIPIRRLLHNLAPKGNKRDSKLFSFNLNKEMTIVQCNVTYMMKKGSSDIIKMSQQGKKTFLLFIVPNLEYDKGNFVNILK